MFDVELELIWGIGAKVGSLPQWLKYVVTLGGKDILSVMTSGQNYWHLLHLIRIWLDFTNSHNPFFKILIGCVLPAKIKPEFLTLSKQTSSQKRFNLTMCWWTEEQCVCVDLRIISINPIMPSLHVMEIPFVWGPMCVYYVHGILTYVFPQEFELCIQIIYICLLNCNGFPILLQMATISIPCALPRM